MDYNRQKQPYLVYLEEDLNEFRKILTVELEHGKIFLLKEIRYDLTPWIHEIGLEVFSSASPTRQIEPIDLESTGGGITYPGIPFNWQFVSGDTIQIHITGQQITDNSRIRLLLVGEYIPERRI